MSQDENELESGESKSPRMNKFAHEISDWLMLATIGFLIIYGVLYLFYEIAIGMAHIRWLFNSFLVICLVDIGMYFITKFAVTGDVNRCLLYMTCFIFICNCLMNLVVPAIVLVSYELTLEHPSTGLSIPIITPNNTEKLDDYVYGEQSPQDCRVDSSGFKCGVVKSIRTSIWCMYILLIPRPLTIYSIVSILIKRKSKFYR